MSKNSRLVYSTDQGRIKSPNDKSGSGKPSPGDGIVRIRRETSGRKGKGVTTISGLDLSEGELKALTKQLKQQCSTGGTIKDGIIEIQGDHRDKIRKTLSDAGYQVKLAGG